MNDPFDLSRFVDAQAPLFDRVDAELRAGRKQTHWMWFVFPQLRGLGHSETARFFGISSREEALAYWKHPLLGPRLLACTKRLLAVQGKSAREILGSPDDLKLSSCMTLFGQIAPGEPAFAQVLERYFGGSRDERTAALLESHSG